ncbi:uncharacterized protein LOC103316930 isoform X1 [Nasonia vitripennis]|uniref:HAT C-terminal dimerisation domain-containing protein n=1 Tax=Nasonia vitripennis TaxID=7425 RepID=A0A7M7LUT2_NASVI|nr:uncharacterized protein LOC103316930 isoform X1 [Nasonia vitripennis]
MLERFLLNSEPITLTLLKFPKAPAMLTALELETAKEFINLLKTFEEAIKIICGDSYVTSSTVIVVLSILHKKLQICKTESENAKHSKQALIDQFTKRFQKIESISLIAIATLLDSRFKRIHFNDRLACSKAIDKISRLLREMTATENNSSLQEKSDKVSDLKEESFWDLHHELAQKNNSIRESRNEDELYDELKYYLNQPTIGMNESPIEYWNRNSTSLSTLAKRYMVIVATSAPSERLFSNAGRIMT